MAFGTEPSGHGAWHGIVRHLMWGHETTALAMKPNKGTAWAVAGVSIGILGLAFSLLGVVIALEGSMNIGPTAFLGIAIAAVGMLVALLAASSIRD